MNVRAGAVLHHLDRLFHRGTVAGLTEGALLERFVIERDESAFAALVARHGPMVLGVCRRVLRDDRDVEDAFQATFLVLVRRAGSIRDGDRIGPWLHGVAHRVAVRARAHSARRSVHEPSAEIAVEPVTTPDDPARRELATIVDEEVARLPSNLRAPVWLCYFEGMSHDEAARRLRWPVGTVRSRMARARDLLRHRLARRGVSADASIVATTLLRMPVPPAWIDATVCHSLTFATGTATAAATITAIRSAALARRVLQAMVITKLSYVSVAGLGLVVALGSVRTLAFQGRGGAASAEPAAPEKPPAAGGLDEAQRRKLEAQIVDLKAQLDQERSRKTPPAVSPRTDERVADMSRMISKIEAELARSRNTIATMEGVLRDVKGELDSIRGQVRKPAASRPETAPPATPARKAGADRPADRPQYFAWGGKLLIISPDGSRASCLDMSTNNYTPVKLPASEGVRREFLSRQPPAPSGEPRPDDRGSPGITPLGGSLLFAVDLDEDGKAAGLLVIDLRHGGSLSESLPRPRVARSSISMDTPGLVVVGDSLYAFSSVVGKWGKLSGYSGSPRFDNSGLWAESKGRVYRFNPRTGQWDDVYGRAMQATDPMTQFDTRFPPSQ